MSRLTKYDLINLPEGGVSKYLSGVGLIPLNEESLTDGLVERFLDAGMSKYFVERPVSLTKEQDNGQTDQIGGESGSDNDSGDSSSNGNDSGSSSDTDSNGDDSGGSGSTGNSRSTKPSPIGKGSRTRKPDPQSGLKTNAGTGNG